MTDNKNLSYLERMPEALKFAAAILFVVIVYVFASTKGAVVDDRHYLIIAAVVGAYMALNIGANDVANNVGPAVGSGALTMVSAIMIAMVFEALGAIIAGGHVVNTIKSGIINPDLIPDPLVFVWLMLAALIAAGIWLNAATAFRAPVSTTHSIVGGVLGAGIAAGGWNIVDWSVMSKIAMSWFISPVMGGFIAAALLYFIKKNLYFVQDRIAAARKFIPILIGLMAWTFSTYLLIKGTKKLFKLEIWQASIIGFAFATAIYFYVKPLIFRATSDIDARKSDINELFTIPLIISSAILSFAHGANDVANAVGPLAAINDTIATHGIGASAAIPLWVMLIGALGIAVGLALFGPKLIHTVGTGITNINKVRAYCIAMSASITVIIASQLGLPISSTHVAVGAVFGVGFLRELMTNRYDTIIAEVRAHHEENNQRDQSVQKFLDDFEHATIEEKSELLQAIKDSSEQILSKKERKGLKNVHKEQLVQRTVFVRIIAAWFITVPCSALLSAFFFYTLKGFFSA